MKSDNVSCVVFYGIKHKHYHILCFTLLSKYSLLVKEECSVLHLPIYKRDNGLKNQIIKDFLSEIKHRNKEMDVIIWHCYVKFDNTKAQMT